MEWNWTGAAGGAGAGFALGGPIGAGAGGVIGGLGGGGLGLPDPLGGLFSGPGSLSKPNKADFQYKGMAEGGFHNRGEELYNQPAVQANLGQYNQTRGLGMQSRGQMTSQIDQLRALSNDPRNSQAYWQMKAGGNQNMQQALALARSGTGGGAAGASNLRQAAMGNAAANQQLNQQIGIMRAGEVAQANSQIGQLLANQRAQDLQAQGLDAQTALQQAQLELGSKQLGQQGLLGMYGMGQQAAALEQKGTSDYWKTLLGAEAAQMQAEAQQKAGILGAAGAVGGGLIAASDVGVKTDVVPLSGGFGVPGQPQIRTTGGGMGGMGSPEIPAGPAGPTWGQRFMGGYNMGQGIFGAAQPHGQIQLGLPEMDITSDDRSKTAIRDLSHENSFLKGALSAAAPQPRVMQRLPMPAAPQPTNEVEAAQYGARWLEDRRREAMQDAMRVSQFKVQNQAAQDQLARAQAMAQQTDAVNQSSFDVNQSVTSDRNAKEAAYTQGMAEERYRNAYRKAFGRDNVDFEPRYAAIANRILRREMGDKAPVIGMTMEDQLPAEQRPGGSRFYDFDKPAGEEQQPPPSYHFGPEVGENQPPPSYHFGPEPGEQRRETVPSFQGLTGAPSEATDAFLGAAKARLGPLEQQAAAVPGYSWKYDPQHGAIANMKQGLAPNDMFGMSTKVGPMAQDLERIPAYRGSVMRGPDGMLRVDGGQVAMTTASALGENVRHVGELEQRIADLEGGKKRKRGKR